MVAAGVTKSSSVPEVYTWKCIPEPWAGILGPETNFNDEIVPGATGGELVSWKEGGLTWALLELAAYPELPTAGGGAMAYGCREDPDIRLRAELRSREPNGGGESKAGLPLRSSHQMSPILSISSLSPPNTQTRSPHRYAEWSNLPTNFHALDQVNVLRSK